MFSGKMVALARYPVIAARGSGANVKTIWLANVWSPGVILTNVLMEAAAVAVKVGGGFIAVPIITGIRASRDAFMARLFGTANALRRLRPRCLVVFHQNH